MRKLTAFTFVTLDGYFEGPKRDISWHRHDEEDSAYAAEMLKEGSTLLFGRVTYELMASYWRTPDAMKNDPIVAEGMNRSDKVVFSRTLRRAEWSPARLVKGKIEEEVERMKREPGKGLALLGSGSILNQLARHGLVDEYQILVDPIVLGDGTSIFKGIEPRLNLKLTATTTRGNGNVLLCYQPVGKA